MDPFEHFYRYTSGRFLFGEPQQLEERYKKFNVSALKDVAAKALSAECTNIIKLNEGSFNKVFLLAFNDGQEAIARIPHPNAGPPHFTTASEVATMDYLYKILKLPVPKILGYSCSSNNPVQSEYILMERIKGVNLTVRWNKLSVSEKEGVVEEIANFVNRLFNVRFSAYGNLYFKRDIPSGVRTCQLYEKPSSDDETYSIGPTTEKSFLEPERAQLHSDHGP
jgi:hypothetical protein